MSRSPEMRVAFFLPSLDGGGAERATVNLIGGLASLGMPVDLLVGRSGGRFTSLVPSSVELVDLRAERVMRAILPLARHLRKRRPAILAGIMDYASVAALEANRVAGGRARVVTVSHSDPFRTTASARGGALLRLFMRMTYGAADAHVTVSRGVREAVARAAHLDADSMTVIPNAVVTAALRSAAAAARRPSPEGPPLVLGLGRLIASKEWPTLMEAVAIIRRRRPLRLMIMGDGPERQDLQSLAASLFEEGVFRLEPFQTDPWPVICSASVVALTSRSEGSPNVLIEAMACGTPSVSTDCRYGPDEILEDGRFGTLVPVGRADLVAEGIEKELDHPRDVRTLCERAEDFSVERVAVRWAELLAGMLP